MMTFQVQDMSCGHCVGTITRAVNTVDPSAHVTVDLRQHLVMVDSAAVDAAAIAQAIAEAGHTPLPVAAAAPGMS